MEHIQTIFERTCNEDAQRRKLSVYTDKNGQSFFNGKQIGTNLSYCDIVAFYAGQDCYYRATIEEMYRYLNWLEGFRSVLYSESLIAECLNKINACKSRKQITKTTMK